MEKKLMMTIEPLPKERPRATVVGGHDVLHPAGADRMRGTDPDRRRPDESGDRADSDR